MAGASGAFSSHVNATLQSLGQQGRGGQQGGSASPHPHPHPAHMLPSAPLLPASTAQHRPQQATVDQIMQQAAAFASTTSGAATTAGRVRQEGSHPNVGSTSLADLVPHVPQVAPPPHAPAVLAPAAAKPEASAPSAGIASHTNSLHRMCTVQGVRQIDKKQYSKVEVSSWLVWCCHCMHMLCIHTHVTSAFMAFFIVHWGLNSSAAPV